MLLSLCMFRMAKKIQCADLDQHVQVKVGSIECLKKSTEEDDKGQQFELNDDEIEFELKEKTSVYYNKRGREHDNVGREAEEDESK